MGARILLASALALTLTAFGARAEVPVDVQLVLAADVSRSIDDAEYRLQQDGYVAAISDPKVIDAIRSGPIGAIAVTYVEWSSDDEQEQLVSWRVIKDKESAQEFAAALAQAKRRFMSATSISGAIDFAMRLFDQGGFETTRRTIDISGDGTNNRGRAANLARDDALKAGVTINALAILNGPSERVAWPEPPVEDFMREHVIGGPGAFVVVVKGFESFRETLKKKLIMEIAGDARAPDDLAMLYSGSAY
jgi:hypothetical protein